MKLKIKRELLLEKLNKVSKAISVKNLIPILSGIKFEINEKGITLTASDNDIVIQEFIGAGKDVIIENEGSIIIQGKYILDIVRKLPDKFINIEILDDLKVLIYTENSEFNLNGISKNEYPSIILNDSEKVININNKVFSDIINETSFAISSDESRPILTGINFKINGNVLECNATDSYRLAKKVINLSSFATESYNFVVPGKNLIEFNKILDNDFDNIEMHIFTNKLILKNGSLIFQTRLINGTFPNTTNLWPVDPLLSITANLNDIYSVIDRASILTADKEKNVITFDIKDSVLTVKSSAAEVGRVEEKLNILKDRDDNIVISFSAKYMMEALKSFKNETVVITFYGEIKPIVIEDSKYESLKQLVLPIRTY